MIMYLEAVDGTTGFGRVGHVVLRKILARFPSNQQCDLPWLGHAILWDTLALFVVTMPTPVRPPGL